MYEEIYPEEFYEFEQIFGELINEEMLGYVLAVVAVIGLVVGIVSLACYIFQSLGLYTIAKRRGIQNPWLAWLPVGNYWIAGSIADQYQYVVNGQAKNRRMILLILSAVNLVLPQVMNAVIDAISVGTIYGTEADYMQVVGQTSWILTVFELITSGVGIVVFVFWQITLYDLYTSCDPKNNVLFLVLGIIFGFTVPFFIFFNRKKELGMPPRKPEPQPEEPQWQPHQPPKEPWDNI